MLPWTLGKDISLRLFLKDVCQSTGDGTLTQPAFTPGWFVAVDPWLVRYFSLLFLLIFGVCIRTYPSMGARLFEIAQIRKYHSLDGSTGRFLPNTSGIPWYYSRYIMWALLSSSFLTLSLVMLFQVVVIDSRKKQCSISKGLIALKCIATHCYKSTIFPKFTWGVMSRPKEQFVSFTILLSILRMFLHLFEP